MKKKKINKGNLIVHLVLIVGSVIMILPFAWMILTSFKTLAESTQMPPKIFPDTLQFSNYTEVMRLLPFDKFYINTILMLFSIIALYSFFCRGTDTDDMSI